MAETNDYTPVDWKGYDYSSAKSAYKTYDAHAGRGYAAAPAVVNKVGAANIVPEKLKTECLNPVVIFSDITGSMAAWPTTIFSKLPYFSNECKTYMGSDVEVCFGAIGDAYTSDGMPLQLRPFSKEADLPARMEELVIVGGGGGQRTETYELGALYCLYNMEMPNAVNPVIIFIGDETPYSVTSKEMAIRECKVDLQEGISTKEVFDRLKEKFSIYFIQKPYGHNKWKNGEMDRESKAVHDNWAELVGEDHIAPLEDPNRVVDVMFGIFAKEAGRIGDFKKEIEARQTKEQVKLVYQSLSTVHKLADKPAKALPAGASTMLKPTKGKPTEDLI